MDNIIRVDTGKYALQATVISVGEDMTVIISGGEKPHIGAAALAVPRPSLRNDSSLSASASLICVTGHKDDLPARKAALILAGRLNRTVLVSVGIHVDAATEPELQRLQNNFDTLINKILLAQAA